MRCQNCKNWIVTGALDYCKICSTKPSPTGDPATCPYYRKKLT